MIFANAWANGQINALNRTVMELPKALLRGVGSVLFVFGFALAGLLILILVRNFARPAELGIVVAGGTALTAFCLLLG